MHDIKILISISFLFFIYGLAFFSMGLAMLLETRRVPLLAGQHSLHPFSLFFFINGIASWVEMGIWLIRGSGYALNMSIYWLHFCLLLISFSALAVFSIRAMHPLDKKPHASERYVTIGLIVIYAVLIFYMLIWRNLTPENQIALFTRIVRYGLAMPGALMSALALWRVSLTAVVVKNRQLRLFLRVVSIGFIFFGVSQILVTTNDWFTMDIFYPSEMKNLSILYLQLVRTVLALIMTWGLIRVSQLVEDERLRQFDAAQQARLDAMQSIEKEMVEREAMRRELLRHIVLVQEDERSRIARELHDETAQFLTAFSLNLATVQNTISKDEKLVGMLENLQNLCKAMAQGIHRMVHDLRPAQLDDLGLAAALQALADEKREAGLDIRFEIDGQSQRLDPIVETVIFRIAQEALTNVVKHAHSPRATLHLRIYPEQVILRVFDQGIGFDPRRKHIEKQGWGLVGMQERAESVGGILQVYSASGEGTLIEVTIPMNDANRPGRRSEARDEYDQVVVS